MKFWKAFRIFGTIVVVLIAVAIYYLSTTELSQPASQETGGTVYYK